MSLITSALAFGRALKQQMSCTVFYLLYCSSCDHFNQGLLVLNSREASASTFSTKIDDISEEEGDGPAKADLRTVAVFTDKPVKTE